MFQWPLREASFHYSSPFPGLFVPRGSRSAVFQMRAKDSSEAELGLLEWCWAWGALQPVGTGSWEFFEGPGFGRSRIRTSEEL